MKKLLLVLLVIFSYFFGQAQTTIGFKGGLNIAGFTGPDVISGASSLESGNVGLFGHGKISPALGLEIEFAVSWQGENYNYSDFSGSYNGSFKFTYLNLPVLLRKKLFEGLFVEIGPQIGLLLDATQTNTTRNSVQSGPAGVTTSTDYSNNVWNSK